METTVATRRKFTEGLLDEERILQILKPSPGQRIVDAGCGTGYMAENFAERVHPSGLVYAVDNDRNFITELKNRDINQRVRPILADITRSIPLDDSSVNLIYISGAIHIFNPEMLSGFINEAKRILQPGGTLAVVEMIKDELPFGPPVSRKYSPQQLTEKITMSALETVSAGKYFYLQRFVNASRPF